QTFRRQFRLLLGGFRNQGEANVWLALNIGRDITAYVGARSPAQICQVATEIIDAGRRPPESQRLGVLVKLFARIKIIGFQQRLRAVELFVGEVILVVKVRDFVIDRFQGRLSFLGRGLRDDANRSYVSLSVIPGGHTIDQTRINQIPLKLRIGLLQNEREGVGGISCRIVFANRWSLPTDLDQDVSHRLFDDV